MWGDEMYMGKPTKLQQMIDVYEKYQKPVFLTMQREQEEDYTRYGYVGLGTQHEEGLWDVTSLIEKPGQAAAPSNQAALGCYILTGDIFKVLETQQPGNGGEIVLAEALSRYAADHEMLAKQVTNLKYFDCGNKLEYMKATIEYALLRGDIGHDFREYLKNLSQNL
jgi:UTP--glucose-1-phosphate uridylyltransferase